MFKQVFLFWGIWPACVMVLAQGSAAGTGEFKLPAYMVAITFCGTTMLYGLDHLAEPLRVSVRGNRHYWSPSTLCIMPSIITTCMIWALPQCNMRQWLWLLALSVGGILYLLITQACLPGMWWFKETWGATCFTLVTWGCALRPHWAHIAAFFPLALSNFYWSSWFDAPRDRKNNMRNPLHLFPHCHLHLTRFPAALSILIFVLVRPLSWPFILTAALHMCWSRKGPYIDFAFIPLLLGLPQVINPSV